MGAAPISDDKLILQWKQIAHWRRDIVKEIHWKLLSWKCERSLTAGVCRRENAVYEIVQFPSNGRRCPRIKKHDGVIEQQHILQRN